MEAQAETIQPISHQHENGETFVANSIESARTMCPFLGRLSIEDAGLLLELETMGKELIAEKTNQTPEKPTITKIEKTPFEHGEANSATDPAREANVSETVHQAEGLDHKIAQPLIIERSVTDIASDVPAESKQPAIVVREAGLQSETEILEIERVREDQQKVQELITTHQYVHHLQNESLAKRSPDMQNAGESTRFAAEPPQAEGPAGKLLFDQDELPNTAETIERGEDELAELTQIEPSPEIAMQELPSPLVEVQATITKLIEVVGLEVAEELGKVTAIVEEIAMLPVKLEVAAAQELGELEEKLESLFIQLFEEANVVYSSELVQSFVKLAQAHYLEELLATAQGIKAEDHGQPKENGTREFLQKLQHGLSTTRQAVVNFYQIGKSIVRLYAYSPEPANINFRVT